MPRLRHLLTLTLGAALLHLPAVQAAEELPAAIKKIEAKGARIVGQFDAPDGRPVSMLFVLLVPEQANETHLQLLSELAQMFSDREFREALQSAPDAAHIHQMFLTWGADAADQRSAAV